MLATIKMPFDQSIKPEELLGTKIDTSVVCGEGSYGIVTSIELIDGFFELKVKFDEKLKDVMERELSFSLSMEAKL